MNLKVLILVATFHFATAQVRTLATINTIWSTDRNNSINAEKTIADNCKNVSETIANLTARLEAQFFSRSLCQSLKDLKSFIDMVATLINWLPYDVIDTCSDVNNQVTLTDFNSQKITCVRTTALQNATRVATLAGSVVANAGQIFVQSQPLYNEAVALYRWVIKNVYNVLINYYAVTLGTALSNNAINRIHLEAYKRTYCSCLNTKTLPSGTNSTQLESNVGTVEKEMMRKSDLLKNASITANDLCKAAFTSLTTGTAAGDLGIKVSNLITRLNAQTTNDDYPVMSWSNIADCTNLPLRIKYLWTKYNQYLQILIANRANCSAIFTANILTNVSAAQPSSLYMTATQITALRDCLNATSKVWTNCNSVYMHLIYSMTRFIQMIVDMQAMSDTYCTCTNATAATTTTTTIATTTTTEITTTTTLSPCGTFVPYTSPSTVAADGFSAGVGVNGSELYVAKGANTMCGQVPCPGYASINGSNPGVFMTCSMGLQNDNSPATASYLQANPALAWVPANLATMATIPGALKFTGGAFNFMYCRTFDEDAKAYFIGKCQVDGLSNGFFFWDPNVDTGSGFGFEFSLIDSFDVLTCP